MAAQPRAISAAAAAIAAFAVLFPAYRHIWGTSPRADLVVTNATIWTADPALPFAEAMAVRSGRVVRIGAHDDVMKLKGRGCSELTLKGNVVLPGFVDSHLHFLIGGLEMGRVDLSDVRSKDEFITRVKEAAKGKPPGVWILGGGWNNYLWDGSLPSSSWIDDFTPENPLWLSRVDKHMGLANSNALKIAGISRDTNDPTGGSIIKCAKGDPTGLLVESAINLLLAVIPEVSLHERRLALQRATRHALMRGVTTVVDFGRYFPGASLDDVWQDLSDVYGWADRAGEMMIRVCLFFPMPSWSQLADLISEKGRSLSQWVHLGGVKGFFDGSLGSSSALFYEPYEDDPGSYGVQVTDIDRILNDSSEADKHELQVAIHAIGDKANDMMLDLFNLVSSSNGHRDRRFRIEHAQHLRPGAAERFGKQGIIASVQPNHLLDDGVLAAKKIGLKRAQEGSYMFKSILSSGAWLAFGSDWPVVDVHPLEAIKTSMYRKPKGIDKAWMDHESIGLDDALKAHTISAAYACFLDHELGSLSVGKYADFVVLPAHSWREFSEGPADAVLLTYVGGKQAYP